MKQLCNWHQVSSTSRDCSLVSTPHCRTRCETRNVCYCLEVRSNKHKQPGTCLEIQLIIFFLLSIEFMSRHCFWNEHAFDCAMIWTCLITSNKMLKTLKFSGSANIDFLSVIQAKNVNNAIHARLVMLKFFHIALRLGFLSAKGCFSLLIGRNDVLEGRYLDLLYWAACSCCFLQAHLGTGAWAKPTLLGRTPAGLLGS